MVRKHFLACVISRAVSFSQTRLLRQTSLLTPGPLWTKMLAHFGSLVQDVVLVGPDRDYLTAMIVPAAGASPEHIRIALSALARTATGSSTLIRRAAILTEPPSIEAGEMTDKGSLNQRAIRENRAALAEAMYADSPSADVICVDEGIGATI